MLCIYGQKTPRLQYNRESANKNDSIKKLVSWKFSVRKWTDKECTNFIAPSLFSFFFTRLSGMTGAFRV